MKRIALVLAIAAAFGSISFTAQEVQACKLLKLLFGHHRHDVCDACGHNRCRCPQIHHAPRVYYSPARPVYRPPLVVPAPEVIQDKPIDPPVMRSRGRSF